MPIQTLAPIPNRKRYRGAYKTLQTAENEEPIKPQTPAIKQSIVAQSSSRMLTRSLLSTHFRFEISFAQIYYYCIYFPPSVFICPSPNFWYFVALTSSFPGRRLDPVSGSFSCKCPLTIEVKVRSDYQLSWLGKICWGS